MTGDNPCDFEKNMAELTQIIESMEQQTLTLEQSMEYFKRGVTITQECQTALKEAEQTVQIITAQDPQGTSGT